MARWSSALSRDRICVTSRYALTCDMLLLCNVRVITAGLMIVVILREINGWVMLDEV